VKPQNNFTLRIDCRQFRSDRPCAPHKQSGKICATCDEYAPSANRILIIKLAAMGDVLRTTCILRGLKATFATPIVWITKPEAVDLLLHNPLIDEIWPVDEKIFQRLEAEPFLAVINPDADRFSSGLCAMARSQKKIGFTLDFNGAILPLSDETRRWFQMGINDKLKRANRETYQALIASSIGAPMCDNELIFTLTEQERATALEFALTAIPRERHSAVIGFNTGGADRWKRKQWPFDHFVELAKRILAETRHAILLCGGAREEEFNNKLCQIIANPRVVNINTKRSVREFAGMLSLCDVLVTGDTLGLHIASALGKQIVAIFGPTSAAEIELYGRGSKLVSPTMQCQGFYRQHCDAVPCCIETITADSVFEAVNKAVYECRLKNG
jgi:heptosyltransferase-2